MKIIQIGATGNAFWIYAVGDKRRCQVKDFIDSLEEDDRAQIVARLHQMRIHGSRNSGQFKKLNKEGVRELRFNSGIRIYCFIHQVQARVNSDDLVEALILVEAIRKSKSMDKENRRKIKSLKKKIKALENGRDHTGIII